MFKKLLAYMGFIPYDHEKEDQTTRRIIEFPNCEEEKEEILNFAIHPDRSNLPIQFEPEISSSKPRREKYDGTFIGDRKSMIERHDKIQKRKELRKNPQQIERRSLFHGAITNVEKDINTLQQDDMKKTYMETQDKIVKKVSSERYLSLKNVR